MAAQQDRQSGSKDGPSRKIREAETRILIFDAKTLEQVADIPLPNENAEEMNVALNDDFVVASGPWFEEFTIVEREAMR